MTKLYCLIFVHAKTPDLVRQRLFFSVMPACNRVDLEIHLIPRDCCIERAHNAQAQIENMFTGENVPISVCHDLAESMEKINGDCLVYPIEDYCTSYILDGPDIGVGVGDYRYGRYSLERDFVYFDPPYAPLSQIRSRRRVWVQARAPIRPI